MKTEENLELLELSFKKTRKIQIGILNRFGCPKCGIQGTRSNGNGKLTYVCGYSKDMNGIETKCANSPQ